MVNRLTGRKAKREERWSSRLNNQQQPACFFPASDVLHGSHGSNLFPGWSNGVWRVLSLQDFQQQLQQAIATDTPPDVLRKKPASASSVSAEIDYQDPSAVQRVLNTNETNFLAQRPSLELDHFLQNHQDSPAARFVELLRTHLHGQPQWEVQRRGACRKRSNPALCMGGFHNVASNTNGDITIQLAEKQAHLPLLPQTEHTTVFRLNRFRDSDNLVANLRTDMACLPLFLAGASIDVRTGMVVELGPFAGFSSKCLAYGVLAAFDRAEKEGSVPKNSVRTMNTRMVSLDTFSELKNFRAITRGGRWVQRVVPEFTEDNPDFLKLWQQTVQYVYPKATGLQGYINEDLINDAKLQQDFGVSAADVLSIDSVKYPQAFHTQLGGLTIKAGSLLFLMDFGRNEKQIFQIYACFRSQYLLPVYISLLDELMAFVVTKAFSPKDETDIYQCYLDTEADLTNRTNAMKARAKQDLAFLAGLTTDPSVHDLYTPEPLNPVLSLFMNVFDGDRAVAASKALFNVGKQFLDEPEKLP